MNHNLLPSSHRFLQTLPQSRTLMDYSMSALKTKSWLNIENIYFWSHGRKKAFCPMKGECGLSFSIIGCTEGATKNIFKNRLFLPLHKFCEPVWIRSKILQFFFFKKCTQSLFGLLSDDKWSSKCSLPFICSFQWHSWHCCVNGNNLNMC